MAGLVDQRFTFGRPQYLLCNRRVQQPNFRKTKPESRPWLNTKRRAVTSEEWSYRLSQIRSSTSAQPLVKHSRSASFAPIWQSLAMRNCNNEIPREIHLNPVLLKYWKQRYALFTKYDEGIMLDKESWYSVTPEKIAEHTANRCRGCGVIVDAFCGSGGNAIQFAFTCKKVIAIDIDPAKIRNAKHNAKIYGVEDRIDFVVGDFFDLAPSLEADVVFLSPPWGGPEFTSKETYQLSDMGRFGQKTFRIARKITENVVFLLPKNMPVGEIRKLAGSGHRVEVEKNELNGRVKTITAYYGEKLIGG